MRAKGIIASVLGVVLTLLGGCDKVDDNRIPSVPVNISLASHDLWNTYGVSGYGQWRSFIRELRQPSGFTYTDRSATGYGGVLLIVATNPFDHAVGPMAYDLSCPVECRPDIRVSVHSDGLVPVAICPVCASHYDIMERGGAGTSGAALGDNVGLRRYECRPSGYGGYVIVN